MKILDTLGFLLGSWDLDRSIEDHRSRTSGSFHGTAVVAATPMRSHQQRGRASYHEAGELCFGTHVGPAARHLEYTTRPGSEVVMIYFADGRPFVDLDIRTGRWQSVHDCGADRYELTTIVLSHRVVEEHWRVRGPGKSYDAVTTLTRAVG